MPENIQGVSFEKSGWAFKASEIDRKFSYGNLQKTLSANLNEAWEKIKDMIMPEVIKRPEAQANTPRPEVKGQSKIPPTETVKQPEPNTRPTDSDHRSWKIAMGLVEDPAQKQSAAPQPRPETAPPKPVEQVPASVLPEPKSAQPVKRNPSIGGVQLTDNQAKILREGGHIYLENMERKDGSSKLSAYVFLDDSGKKVFSSNENPDNMVKYGDITIRLRDKIQVEKGYVVKVKMKWWGGIPFQHPSSGKTPKQIKWIILSEIRGCQKNKKTKRKNKFNNLQSK